MHGTSSELAQVRKSAGRHRAERYRPPPQVQTLVVRASEGVVRVDAACEVLGPAGRAVVQVERDGTPLDELLLLRCGTRVVALVNRCPHLYRALDDAVVRGKTLVCPGHGRRYRLPAGRAVGRPSAAALCTLPVQFDGETLVVDISGLDT